jgi:hypothetical protein
MRLVLSTFTQTEHFQHQLAVLTAAELWHFPIHGLAEGAWVATCVFPARLVSDKGAGRAGSCVRLGF